MAKKIDRTAFLKNSVLAQAIPNYKGATCDLAIYARAEAETLKRVKAAVLAYEDAHGVTLPLEETAQTIAQGFSFAQERKAAQAVLRDIGDALITSGMIDGYKQAQDGNGAQVFTDAVKAWAVTMYGSQSGASGFASLLLSSVGVNAQNAVKQVTTGDVVKVKTDRQVKTILTARIMAWLAQGGVSCVDRTEDADLTALAVAYLDENRNVTPDVLAVNIADIVKAQDEAETVKPSAVAKVA